MTQRVALALLQAEPDAPESPMRRLAVASFCSVMVAVLVVAGFGIWGLVFKGGAQGLEKPGTLIIEAETGTKYGYSAQDHKMIPFLNYASARLAMPGGSVDQRTVSRASLEKYDRGPVTGIVGAPDSLPDAKRLAKAPWSLCVHRADSQSGLPSSVVSLVGGKEVGGQSLSGDQAVVVQGGDQAWLVWNNERMRVSPEGVRLLTNDQPAAVADRWLNGLPEGPPFAAPDIPGRGQSVTGPTGQPAQVGQVYHVGAVAGSPESWYVQLSDGLAGLSQSEANLLLRDPKSQGELSKPVDISAASAAAHPSAVQLHKAGLPQSLPTVVPYDPSVPLCAVYSDTDSLRSDARLTIGGSLPDPHTAAVATPTGGQGALDQVVLSGGGTLAGVLTGSGLQPQSYFLVTDQGIRFPVPSADAVGRLGYSAAAAVPVPGNLLQLLPEGPVLSPEAALVPVPGGGVQR